jgi:hypothetical protein
MSRTVKTARQVKEPQPEELVSWTCREWLRCLWYRLRLTVQEMNNAAAGWPSCRPACQDNRHPARRPSPPSQAARPTAAHARNCWPSAASGSPNVVEPLAAEAGRLGIGADELIGLIRESSHAQGGIQI